MPINTQALERAARKAAMDAMERGVHAGCSYMEELLKLTVSGPSGGVLSAQKPRGLGKVSMHLYREQKGFTPKTGNTSLGLPRTHGKDRWVAKPPEWGTAVKIRETPPGMKSGKGRESIGYQIKNRNDAAGTITVWIGVDASAAGGMCVLKSYLLGWDTGIRVKGPGTAISAAANREPRTGPVVQHPWLRSTISAYWESFVSVVTARM